MQPELELNLQLKYRSGPNRSKGRCVVPGNDPGRGLLTGHNLRGDLHVMGLREDLAWRFC